MVWPLARWEALLALALASLTCSLRFSAAGLQPFCVRVRLRLRLQSHRWAGQSRSLLEIQVVMKGQA